MTAQERPSLGQPPHLTLPHTQCSHRNTYKDLERRPARGRRGKKSLRRARWGQERGLWRGGGVAQILNSCETKPASSGTGRSGGRGTIPARPPSRPSTVAHNKVQICPVHSSTPFPTCDLTEGHQEMLAQAHTAGFGKGV